MPLLSRVPGEVSESAFVEGPVYVCACVLSHVRLSATPRTIVHQAPLSMGSPRQEYWDGLPFLSPGEGLGEQQSTRPDQLPLHPFPPPSLVHSLFLSIQPLSKAHPCHPLPQSILSPSPLPRPVASHDNKRWTKATDTWMSGVGFLQKKSETLDFDIFKKKKFFILHKK